jgi:uncharacterized protein (DUF608 family)
MDKKVKIQKNKMYDVLREHLDYLQDRDNYNDGIHKLSDEFYEQTDILRLNTRYCTDSWILT